VPLLITSGLIRVLHDQRPVQAAVRLHADVRVIPVPVLTPVLPVRDELEVAA
jgi:hypothetical protein